MNGVDSLIEPIWNQGKDLEKKECDSILAQYLNWYNANKTVEHAKKYLIDYLVKTKRNDKAFISAISAIPDKSFIPTKAFLCRIIIKSETETPEFFRDNVERFIDEIKFKVTSSKKPQINHKTKITYSSSFLKMLINLTKTY